MAVACEPVMRRCLDETKQGNSVGYSGGWYGGEAMPTGMRRSVGRGDLASVRNINTTTFPLLMP
jgi:hypothetical protein